MFAAHGLPIEKGIGTDLCHISFIHLFLSFLYDELTELAH
jgi:hypothetical protein